MDTVAIVYVISNIFITLAIERLMRVFFDERRTSRAIYVLSYILYTILGVSIWLLFYIPFLNVIRSIITIFLLTYNYISSLRKKFFAVFTVYLFIVVSELIVINLFGFVNFKLFDKIVNEYDILTYALISIIMHLSVSIIQIFKNIKKDNIVSKLYWLSAFIIPFLSIMLMFLLTFNLEVPNIIMIIFIVAILLINILTIYLHDSLSSAYADKLKSSLHEQEKEYYYSQCELMRKSTNEIKAFKHDIQNHMSVVSGFIKENKSDEADSYLLKLIGEVAAVTNYSNTGNTALDSIINYKLRNVKEKTET